MTKKTLFIFYSWFILALSVCSVFLMLFSWFGTLYGLELGNLLSIEGIRWILRNSLIQTQEVFPFVSLLILAMALGICHKSGWFSVLFLSVQKKLYLLSYKQRWGLQISLFVVLGYSVLIIWGLFSSSWSLLSIRGTLEDSPLIEGFALWFSLGIGIVGSVYGWLSGTIRNIYDLIAGMLNGVRTATPLFVLLFILLHFIQICNYVF